MGNHIVPLKIWKRVYIILKISHVIIIYVCKLKGICWGQNAQVHGKKEFPYKEAALRSSHNLWLENKCHLI